jgi:uncharacterized protein
MTLPITPSQEQPMQTSIEPPWYRQPWPWFLIALPATAVVAGLITATLAVRGFDGPVAADYYRQGLAINEEVARAQLARELGLLARVELADIVDGSRVRVEVQARERLPAEAAMRLRLVHPGRPSADRLAVLARQDVSADGQAAVYVGSLQSADAASGATAGNTVVTWQVILETPQWRIDDSITGGGGNYTLQAR